ncbi:hypothetical protein [Streptosporangium sp. NPDC050280]|uniref:hypothetical protein n=1 Tax=unclassified Streptosporangium TaxID=2632669 RepID=UPI00342DFC76
MGGRAHWARRLPPLKTLPPEILPPRDLREHAEAERGPRPGDPAAPGRYTVVHDEYDLGDTAITLAGLGGRQAGIRAKTYPPKEATGRLPLVVFQHGRHSACYNPVTRQTSNTTWPCPAGQQPILGFTGYGGPADVLASHGYAVVSVSANGVNAADNPFSEDRARSHAARSSCAISACSPTRRRGGRRQARRAFRGPPRHGRPDVVLRRGQPA